MKVTQAGAGFNLGRLVLSRVCNRIIIRVCVEDWKQTKVIYNIFFRS